MIKSIIKYIHSLFHKKKVEIVYVEVKVEVLSTSAMKRLRSQVEPPIISGSDSPQAAAYRLGIQRALLVVEEKFSA